MYTRTHTYIRRERKLIYLTDVAASEMRSPIYAIIHPYIKSFFHAHPLPYVYTIYICSVPNPPVYTRC